MDIAIVKEIRENYNLTREEFAERLGITIETLNTWEYRTKAIPKRKKLYIEKVFSAYFNGDDISEIPEKNYTMVEFIDLEKTKGILEFGKVELLPNNQKRLIPIPEEKGNYLVVKVLGHSMDDNTKRSISNGDEILIKQYKGDIDLLPIRSKLFVIVDKSGITIKQITEIEEDAIVCHSFNPIHQDFIIKKEEILQIFTVEKKMKSNIIF